MPRGGTSGAVPSSSLSSSHLGVAVALLALAVAYRGLVGLDGRPATSADAMDALLFSPSGSSPRLIFILAIWFGVRRWARVRAHFDGATHPIGIVLLLIAAALCTWANFVAVDELLVPSLSLLILGGSALFGGVPALRASVLPAVFLFLAIPPPIVLLNAILFPMQIFIAQLTETILSRSGVEVYRFTEQLWIDGHVFQVIETCSGLRTIQSLVMAAFVYCEVFHRDRVRLFFLVGLAPVLGMLVNELRVISIALNPLARFATVHTGQGIVMIVVGVLLLSGLDSALGRLLPERPAPKARQPSAPIARSTMGITYGLAILLPLALASLALPRWQPKPDTAMGLSYFAGSARGWNETSRLQMDRLFLGSVGFDRCLLRDYWRGEDWVELLICADRRLAGGNRMLSRKLEFPGSGWRSIDPGHTELAALGIPVDFAVAYKTNEKRLVYSWRTATKSLPVEILRGIFALDRGPFARSERALFVRISTHLAVEGLPMQAARARIEAFADDFHDPFAKLGAIPGA